MATEVTKAYTKVQDVVDDALWDAMNGDDQSPFLSELSERIFKAIDAYVEAVRDEESST